MARVGGKLNFGIRTAMHLGIVLAYCSIWWPILLAHAVEVAPTGRSVAEYFPSEVFWDTLKTLVGQPKLEVGLGEVEVRFNSEMAETEKLDFIVETVNMDDDELDSYDCAFQLDEWLAHFMLFIESHDLQNPAVQYVNQLAADKIERCASRFDAKFRRSSKHMLEWSLDKFFEHLTGLKDGASNRQLLREAERFDLHDRTGETPLFTHPDEQVCRLAAAFNHMQRKSSGLHSIREGWAQLGRWSSSQMNRKLRDSMKNAETTADCEAEVGNFFDRTCRADRPDFELDLIVVNTAVAFGNEPAKLMRSRARKYREYKRICYTFNLNGLPVQRHNAR